MDRDASEWVLFALGAHDLGLMPLMNARRIADAWLDVRWERDGLPQDGRDAGLSGHQPKLKALPPGAVLAARLRWLPDDASTSMCSQRIAALADALRREGWVTGWRDELYRVERPQAEPCAERGEALFLLERSAFRFFGFMSRAVHVHGERQNGLIWVARRALHKAIDPGRLDNLAAGGLGAHESWQACAVRELQEEAGVPKALTAGLQSLGAVRSTRVEPEGLHDEVLHLASLRLPQDFVPRNQDGEVESFSLMSAATCLEHLGRGEFTVDAAWATRRAMGWCDEGSGG